MKNSLMIILLIFLFGCSITQKQIYKQKFANKIKIPALPAWIIEGIPQNCIVGIARKSSDQGTMLKAARQMAAVMHSRNKASFTVDKFAATIEENPFHNGKASFKINVSASPEETAGIYDKLVLQDSVFLYGYFLCLFSTGEQDLSVANHTKKIGKLPENFARNKLIHTERFIEYHSTYSSSDLITAWQEAADNARYEIAKYYEKEVQSAIINENQRVTKEIVLETKRILSGLRIEKSFVTTELRDNLRTYKVYHKFLAGR